MALLDFGNDGYRTLEEIAEALGVSRKTLMSARQRHGLRSRRIGDQYIVFKHDFYAWQQSDTPKRRGTAGGRPRKVTAANDFD